MDYMQLNIIPGSKLIFNLATPLSLVLSIKTPLTLKVTLVLVK